MVMCMDPEEVKFSVEEGARSGRGTVWLRMLSVD